jgi:hypothetical protein
VTSKISDRAFEFTQSKIPSYEERDKSFNLDEEIRSMVIKEKDIYLTFLIDL